MKKYLSLEQIREKLRMNQTDFAKQMGLSFRGYQARLNGERPHWRFEELVKVANLNDGKISLNIINTEYDGTYDVLIKKR